MEISSLYAEVPYKRVPYKRTILYSISVTFTTTFDYKEQQRATETALTIYHTSNTLVAG